MSKQFFMEVEIELTNQNNLIIHVIKLNSQVTLEIRPFSWSLDFIEIYGCLFVAFQSCMRNSQSETMTSGHLFVGPNWSGTFCELCVVIKKHDEDCRSQDRSTEVALLLFNVARALIYATKQWFNTCPKGPIIFHRYNLVMKCHEAR